jgi:hypothetical protein
MEKKHIVFIESLNFGWVVNDQTLRRIQTESRQCRYEWLSALVTNAAVTDLESSLP